MTAGAFVLGVAGLPLHDEAATRPTAAVPPRDPHRRGHHPARRPRRRGHRRHAGQDHDRGPADEDGGGRGALRDRASAARRSPSSPSAPPTGRRRSSPSRSPACCPSSAPAPSTGRSRASTPARAVRRDVRPGPGAAAFTDGRLHARSIPVTYWSFRFMIGLGMFAAAGAALHPVADAQAAGRPASGGSACSGSACRSLATLAVSRWAGSSPRWAASRGSSSG